MCVFFEVMDRWSKSVESIVRVQDIASTHETMGTADQSKAGVVTNMSVTLYFRRKIMPLKGYSSTLFYLISAK